MDAFIIIAYVARCRPVAFAVGSLGGKVHANAMRWQKLSSTQFDPAAAPVVRWPVAPVSLMGLARYLL